MYLARILYPVEVLGPGKRIGLWFSGCPHHCPGCSNPELWEAKEGHRITPEAAERLIRSIACQHPVDGFTLTGGEPARQAEEISVLLTAVRDISADILMYTGYRKEELTGAAQQTLLRQVSVLIDGTYEDEKNNGTFLKGSDNQQIHILRDADRELYEAYLRDGTNQIQNFLSGRQVISVGIHNRGFKL